jgi:hypothetical protein
MFDKVSRDLLYEECKGGDMEHTVLWMTLELLKLKASSGWSDTSFSAILELLTKVMPKTNGLPSSTYQAKKIIYPLTLDTEKIHAYPNHCILYRKEHKFKNRCLRRNASRYKRNDNSEEVEDDSNKKGKKDKDERGRMPLPIRTLNALKREKFLLLWCGTYLWSTAWIVCSQTQGMLSCCFGMWIAKRMKRFDTLGLVDSGNNLILLIRRTSLMIQEISGLDLARMEWIHSERWETHTVCGQ